MLFRSEHSAVCARPAGTLASGLNKNRDTCSRFLWKLWYTTISYLMRAAARRIFSTSYKCIFILYYYSANFAMQNAKCKTTVTLDGKTECVSQYEILDWNRGFVTKLSYLVFTFLGSSDKINRAGESGFFPRKMW